MIAPRRKRRGKMFVLARKILVNQKILGHGALLLLIFADYRAVRGTGPALQFCDSVPGKRRINVAPLDDAPLTSYHASNDRLCARNIVDVAV